MSVGTEEKSFLELRMFILEELKRVSAELIEVNKVAQKNTVNIAVLTIKCSLIALGVGALPSVIVLILMFIRKGI